jgi:flagellar biosynthetic protein FliS
MRGIAAYKSVSLESSDQRKLVVMCFEALIRRQKAAIEAFEAKKFIDGTEHVRISREIYCELLIGLDHEAAPEMTTNLAGLYHYCIRELTVAGHESTSEHIETSLVVTQQLYDGFQAAFSQGS